MLQKVAHERKPYAINKNLGKETQFHSLSNYSQVRKQSPDEKTRAWGQVAWLLLSYSICVFYIIKP